MKTDSQMGDYISIDTVIELLLELSQSLNLLRPNGDALYVPAIARSLVEQVRVSLVRMRPANPRIEIDNDEDKSTEEIEMTQQCAALAAKLIEAQSKGQLTAELYVETMSSSPSLEVTSGAIRLAQAGGARITSNHGVLASILATPFPKELQCSKAKRMLGKVVAHNDKAKFIEMEIIGGGRDSSFWNRYVGTASKVTVADDRSRRKLALDGVLGRTVELDASVTLHLSARASSFAHIEAELIAIRSESIKAEEAVKLLATQQVFDF